MMKLYSYKCEKCGFIWEESLPEEERSVPMQAPCQSCNKSGHIIRALEPPIFKRKETKNDF